MSRRAFTLVELLVVIAIVAILFAMMLPAINQARKVSKQIACATNTRTWTLVLSNYAIDNRGFFPPRVGVYSNVPRATWFGLTNPYLRAGGTTNTAYNYYFCPDGTVPSNFRPTFVNVLGGAMEYVIYAAMPSPVGIPAPRMPVRLDDTRDQFSRPKVMVGDVSRWNVPYPTNPNNGTPLHATHETTGKPHYSFDSDTVTGLVYQMGIPMGTNIGYVDGSVRWNRWERMDFTKYMSGGGDATYLWDKDY